MVKIREAILVEGRYDKNTLSHRGWYLMSGGRLPLYDDQSHFQK